MVAAATAPLPQLKLELEEGDRVVPMSPQRKLIAAHMVYSKHTSPHVGTVAEVDLGGVVALRARHAASFKKEHGTGLTYLPFIARVVGRERAIRKGEQGKPEQTESVGPAGAR